MAIWQSVIEGNRTIPKLEQHAHTRSKFNEHTQRETIFNQIQDAFSYNKEYVGGRWSSWSERNQMLW